MSNLPDDYDSYNEYCTRHNIYYHPVDGCPACEEEPAMLKHTIPEAKETLEQLEKVSASYEHRIDVVQDRIDVLRKQLDRLVDELDDIYSMTRSLDYDIDCVMNDEPPDGFHINELFDNEFCMPEPVSCDCLDCTLVKIDKKYGSTQ